MSEILDIKISPETEKLQEIEQHMPERHSVFESFENIMERDGEGERWKCDTRAIRTRWESEQ